MRLSTAWNWELGIGILEDNVFGQTVTVPRAVDPLIEKRCEPRVSFSLPVRYRQKGQNLPWLSANSVDISRNGIRLALDRQMNVGTCLEMDIKLPEMEKTVKIQGVIVWANPSRNGQSVMECGIAFQNLRHLSNREKIMYFMADKICSLADRNARQFSCRPAGGTNDLEKAYRLTYREYLAKNYCSPDASAMHYTFYCLMPGSQTFLLERNENFIGTISVLADSPAGLPLETIFPEEIGSLRKPGRKLAEVGLLALDGEAFEKKTFSLTDFQKLTGSFRLFKIMFDYARLQAGVTDLVIGMHPKHKELYRYLHFDPLGPVKSYPGAEGKPALLMHMDIKKTADTVSLQKGAGSYFLKDPTPLEVLERGYSWTPADVHDFLLHKKNLARQLTPKHFAILKQIYPGLDLGPYEP